MNTYRVETTTDQPLVEGAFITGTSIGYSRRTGRVMFRSAWSGVYVGVQNPDATDPWLNRDGTPAKDQGGSVHLFRDGEINGIAQSTHGIPVENF